MKFSGVMAIGKERQAVINGVAFTLGERKTIKLRDKSVMVHCREIHEAETLIEVNDVSGSLTLQKGEEKLLP